MRQLLCIPFTCSILPVNSQVVSPGDLSISVGLGNFQSSTKWLYTGGYSEKTGLSGRQFPLRLEYVVSEHLSGNVSIAYTSWNSRYFDRFEPHNWIDLGIGAGYHIPWERRHLDIATEAGCGYSRYLFRDYDTSGYSEKANGLFIRAGIAPKLFLGKSQMLGVVVYYRFTYYYMGGTVNTQFAPTYEFEMTGLSHAWGAGIFYRFGTFPAKPYIDSNKPEE